IVTILPEGDEPHKDPEKVKVNTVNYQYTDAAAHLLSLVSGVSLSEIKKVNINNATGSLLPAYDPKKGGGAMTLPTGYQNKYDINFTDNFFDKRMGTPDYGQTDYSNDVLTWL